MAVTIGPIYILANGLDAVSNDGSDTDGSVGFSVVTQLGRQGRTGGTYFQSGYKFTNIAIPQGATILSASVSIWTHPVLGGRADTVEWKITGLDVDDAVLDTGVWSANYRPGTGGAPGRGPETTAKVDWDRTGFVVDTKYTSPDISPIIREIVGRPGWTSGNDLAIIIRNDGTNVGEGFMRHRLLGEIGTTRANHFDCTYGTARGQIIRIQTA